ncbi:hypothetical protein ACIRL2_02815 [Embleya sp. NPDC127516]|uniref:hypothetical protein n=1 Tax=Embleya sp. NPDC127516 TaxID=3363990 RepID=UPI003809E7AE
MPPIGSANVFRTQLVAGQATERRLLISDLAAGSSKACRESLSLAKTVFPSRRSVTRSVVAVSAVDQLDFWRDVLVGSEADDGVVVLLRKHDERALRDWTQRHSRFETDERMARLSRATGGWPCLLDKALELWAVSHDQDEALRELELWLGQNLGAQEFVDAVGLLRDDTVMNGYLAIVDQLDTGWNSDGDCRAALELVHIAPDEARWALSCLEALQVLDRDVNRLRVDPVLHTALGVMGRIG